MKKKALLFSLLLAALLLLCGAAAAREARDITAECAFLSKGSPSRTSRLYDGDYHVPWETIRGKYVYLQVTLPEGETCSGVQIKWHAMNENWHIELKEGDEWVPYAGGGTDYLTTYTPLPEVTEFRIAARQRVSNRLAINEMNVLSAGETPAWVQRWEPAWDRADLLLVVAHPDDEYVFMGGLIPYYGAEREKQVLVAYITESTAERRTELLDGLWTCGQTHYPLTGQFYDRYTTSLNVAYEKLGQRETRAYMVRLFRQYRPDVVVTHDFDGEYGHGVHKVCADIVKYALERSADPACDPDSAEEWGLWDVPKCYYHLWEENRVVMDWDVPLKSLGGKSAYETACEAFSKHLSQQGTEYRVYVDGPYDSRLFGLYRSLVGPDENGGDFFEHLEKPELLILP